MATEHVDQNKQPEQVYSSSEWSATTSRMVIEFSKENRALWDRNHKDYGKYSVQKKLFTPLVAKLTRLNVPKSEPEIKKRWHNLRTSALHYFRKQSSGGREVKWTYWKDMSFLQEHLRWSAMLNLELVQISPLPNSLACPEQMSCRRSSADEATCCSDGATCRSDLSHLVSRP